MRHVIGDKLQHCCDHFRNSAGNRYVEIAAAADHRHKPKNFAQRDTFAAENVAMSNLSAFHGQNQPCRDIAHIDEVYNEIEIQLKTRLRKCRSITVGGVTL